MRSLIFITEILYNMEKEKISLTKRFWLWTEFAILFVGLPIFFYMEIYTNRKILPLVIFTLATLLYLRRDRSFNNRKLVDGSQLKIYLKKFLPRTILISLFILGLTLWIKPESLFIFPRTRPLIWIMVMCLYPFLSAYPQEVIYRGFLFHRYRHLFPNEKMMIIISAFAFSFLHIIYDNIPAVLLTLPGGLLFAKTYKESGSIWIAAIEHAIYGLAIFTIGLGHLFYEG